MSGAPPGITLVAIITVRAAALDQFRAFEQHAAKAMKAHGGRIERTVVVAQPEAPETLREIHVVTFPDTAAFAAYRADPGLRAVAALRDASVLHTEVLVGVDGPDYGALC